MEAKVKTWLHNIHNGNIKSKTQIILNCIYSESESGGIDTNSLRERLGIAHQTLTGIISTLQDNGLVKVIDVIEHMNNWYSVYQFVEDPIERVFLKNQREREKILNWLKQGIVKHADHCSPLFKKLLKNNYDEIQHGDASHIQLTLF
jgi:hypothetical protein